MRSNINSPIVTLTVGPTQRLFAAHQETLGKSGYFASLCKSQFFETSRRIALPDEEPEVFSAVLEYLYKGDYYPRLEMDKKRGTWYLEDNGRSGTSEHTIYHTRMQAHVLKDTAIYVRHSSPFLPRRFHRSFQYIVLVLRHPSSLQSHHSHPFSWPY